MADYKTPKAFGVIDELTNDVTIPFQGEQVFVLTGLAKVKRRFLMQWAGEVIERTYEQSRRR